MAAQFINWKWVGIAALLTALLVGGFLVATQPDRPSTVGTKSAAASAAADAPTGTIAPGPPLTQPPLGGGSGSTTQTVPPTTPPPTTPVKTQASAPVSIAPPVITGAEGFQAPAISDARAMRCTKSGGQLVTVEWIAHLEGGSNWRALNAIRSQDFNPVSSKTKESYDVWFSTQTLVADGSAPGSIPSRIQFASTLPYDSMSTTVAGPDIPLAGVCR